jgi:hypothetical protein
MNQPEVGRHRDGRESGRPGPRARLGLAVVVVAVVAGTWLLIAGGNQHVARNLAPGHAGVASAVAHLSPACSLPGGRIDAVVDGEGVMRVTCSWSRFGLFSHTGIARCADGHWELSTGDGIDGAPGCGRS